jgi:hypothetical protein
MITKKIFLFCLVFISCLSVRSQSASGIQNIIASIDTLRSRMPAEKLYIQFDKSYYISGDTIRMKAYLFDAAFFRGSDKSGIVYIELANDTNKVLFKRMLPIGYGLGTGNIVLNKEDIPEGSYTLRAYTNLMRNFGEDLMFKKNFYISSSTAQNLLVNSQTTLSKQDGKDNLRIALQFTQLNKQALASRELDLRVLDSKKVIHRDKVNTDIEGKLDVNFDLPEKLNMNSVSLLASELKDNGRKITIPITFNRTENIDLQFMPEGGNMVAGIPVVVGFKAIGEDGKGVAVNGKVFSGHSEQIAVFSTSYKGMGSFEFTPKAEERYTAKIELNGIEEEFPIPMVKRAGTAMRVTNVAENDSIEVLISSTDPGVFYLTAQSRGIICYGAIIRYNGNNPNTRKIAKSLFPTGIVRFTLLSAEKQPLNERITFIDHHDNLNIFIKAGQTTYKTRDSIALAIEVKDHEGKPVEGSFSMTVTDDWQVKTDSLTANLLTSLLLTSDLKGTLEDPGHYFQQEAQSRRDLNNLLLTQGWIGYKWKDVFDPPQTLIYPSEPDFVVSGKVTNIFNKGSAVTSIQLLSLKPTATKIGVTAKDGSFSFDQLPVAEDLKFFLQAKNKNGRNNNVGIQVDEYKPAIFRPSNNRIVPWYVNSDTILLRQIATKAIEEAKLNGRETNLLEEVTITRKKIVKDSKNLNGAGEADQILDEKDMANSPHKSLLDLMYERVKGFNLGRWPSYNVTPVGLGSPSGPGKKFSGMGGRGTDSKVNKGTIALAFHPVSSYKINDKEMHLVIDGIDVESLYYPMAGMPYATTDVQLVAQQQLDPTGDYILERNSASPTDRQEFIKLFLDNITAEDVKGLEVMSDPRYNGRYKTKYASRILSSLSVAGPDFAYVEVTTYSGNGAFVKTPPGVYLLKPISYLNNAAFYRPKYIVKTNPLSDFRSTIHWEPDIITGKDGKAIVSFYSADHPGTYSIIIEGSNMNGSIGRQTGMITIK